MLAQNLPMQNNLQSAGQTMPQQAMQTGQGVVPQQTQQVNALQPAAQQQNMVNVAPLAVGAAAVGVGGVGAGAAGGGAPQFASLYVGDLDNDVTEAMLYEIFNTVGPVASIRVCRDSVTRRSLGYAYVNFHSAADAERVMDTLNYSTIKGRCCRIMWSHRDPNLRRTGNGNVFVKNLDKNVDNKALYDTFSLFGNILSCKVAVDTDGKSRGYGFVHYETAEAAKQAIEKVNNMQIGEKTVFVGEFLPRDGRTPAEIVNFTNIYVKNYPAEWEESRLLEEFSKFGEVTSSMVQKDKKGRPFAFLNFAEAEAAQEAIKELHRKDFRSDEEKEAAPYGRNAKGEPYEKPDDEKNKTEADDAGGDGEKKEEDDKSKTETEDVGGDEEKHHPDHLLFVSRAMTKSERENMLKAKFKGGPTTVGAAATGPAGVNLYIKNLPDEYQDSDLKEMFTPFGEITSARVMMDASTNPKRSKGFGFVCYKTSDEATRAVSEMHLKTIRGKPLYVGLAERKDERSVRLAQRYKGEKGAGGLGMQGGIMPGMGGMQGMQQAGMMMGKGGMFDQSKGGMMMKGQMMPGYPAGQAGYPAGQQGMAMGQNQMGKGLVGQQMGGPGGPGAMARPGGMMAGPGQMNPQMGQMGQNPLQQNQMRVPQYGNMMPQTFPNQLMQQQPGMMQNKGMPGAKGFPQQLGPMGGKGQMMPNMQQQQRPQPVVQPQAQQPNNMTAAGAAANQHQALTAAQLAQAPPGMQKQMLGEKLYPAVSRLQPDLAGKITGMMLEMDNNEVLMMLESDIQLRQKVDEAVRVLNNMK